MINPDTPLPMPAITAGFPMQQFNLES